MSKRANNKRAAARAIRQLQVNKQRRRRGFRLSVIAAVSLLAVALGGYAIYANSKELTGQVPTGAIANGTGIVSGSGPVRVDLYLDYLCPSCRAFHTAMGEKLAAMAQENTITLTTYPIAILDRYSSNNYSTRSASAAGCAADSGGFADFSDLLFERQPAEGGAGHTNDQLIALGRQASLGDVFAGCVRDGIYSAWPRFATEEASKRGVTGTPTLFVNDRMVVAGQGQSIADAVEKAIAAGR